MVPIFVFTQTDGMAIMQEPTVALCFDRIEIKRYETKKRRMRTKVKLYRDKVAKTFTFDTITDAMQTLDLTAGKEEGYVSLPVSVAADFLAQAGQ